ncbi:DNA repair protein rhp42 [Nannizzia gypsea CBS 118893]|uniref:DNA repair protein rhp42 n=1 Tax=Arthroderma gypseum (strain ATCC MYA-4604 / CBS 118893) TaxID=535722 RepID=E4V3H0_ARTGP|nr:DNA repair protein rhp42 [Nannizzia gypsea CBS 118893]EFR04544.1 DNA repair protein rhp42 [Nannizzia gypsea CBS 118893]
MPRSLASRKNRNARGANSRLALLEALDTPPEPSADAIKTSKFFNGEDFSSEDSSLSEPEESESALQDNSDGGGDDDEDEDEDVNWEDATSNATPHTQAPAPALRDLSIVLERNEESFAPFSLSSKKGPSKIDRLIRTQTHCMHVQFLLFHNAVRNSWINDSETKNILLSQLPAKVKKHLKNWRSAVKSPNSLSKGQDEPAYYLLAMLASYWAESFKITAPGLRKRGYRPIPVLGREISKFNGPDEDGNDQGEIIRDITEFRELARQRQGSRDVGGQLFTSLLRAVGLEARMVASLQPIGFGWSKFEDYNPKEKPSHSEKKIDKDLSYPIYWSEVVSPITNDIIPVEALVLPFYLATTPERLAMFEPPAPKAEKAKQVIAYVIAYSPDATAKDVTIRYLKKQAWPGKTKGFRIPVERIPYNKSGIRVYYEYDWFRTIMRGYVRPANKRTIADTKEDEALVPSQAKNNKPKEGETLQSLKASDEFVLERFLKREEALRSGATHVRTFTTGKNEKKKEEKVYKRSDVVRCLSAESWHKEGRKIKMGETPLKLVPIRAVTLNRKREVDELHRETGEKPMQGLYARYQTEFIIPPPIKDGIIPKNEYGNIDCFVPSMIPRGAAHVPFPGTVRVCKKLGIDYAEAVTGFEFGSKMAVPIIEGVVVAAENEDLLKDAWIADEQEKRRKEKLKHDKLILATWRKFIMGLRINDRLQEEYGGVGETESHNPFSSRMDPEPPQPTEK